ncbi:MAG: hypothetical protein M1831_005069 [Alyxoria varia]|nr:MAG: hypothetical protein M1831_005069 [Alyxoria varia]
MAPSVAQRLLQRELGDRRRYSKPQGIYGDRKWVKDLDIVSELDGHSGCVNALTWSKSGRLLASGSDDTHLNIHKFQPDEINANFKLATTVATGHTQNIFSTKFMPHSNDRIVVTAAGDGEVRIFDLEGNSQTSESSTRSTLGSSRVGGYLHNGLRYLSEGDTNAKVFRSHNDRVKRIVTESSPHTFLSCSEDGEVRQWDIRQPSSAYPPRQRRGRGFGMMNDDTNVPPPLISYKKQHLDLNTISCSPSQPHYIALGGAHLHCFLHDRRMLGRDRTEERGGMHRSNESTSDHQEDMLTEATRCVKRFAPQGQRKMKRGHNGHITACKISDANPNEMIVSWSGDWIYNFDLLRHPDAREGGSSRSSQQDKQERSARVKQGRERKRKRVPAESTTSLEAAGRAGSKPRTTQDQGDGNLALRVQYGNGQSENIPLRDGSENTDSSLTPGETSSSHVQQDSRRIADTSVKVRKAMFSLHEAGDIDDRNPTGHGVSFLSVLNHSAPILRDIHHIMSKWRYPVDVEEMDVVYQNTLRRDRERIWRFVQASGTLARVLGGTMQAGSTDSEAIDAARDMFQQICPEPCSSGEILDDDQFCYDFVKAITLWLDSGPGALVEGFTKSKSRFRNACRFPISDDSSIGAIDEVLIPYLLRLASDRTVQNVDASKFEVNSNRQLFESEKAAVLAFASAVKLPFEDLSQAVIPSSSHQSSAESRIFTAQDRKAALRYWGLKVARGVLFNASIGLNHAFVDRAFGGTGNTKGAALREERGLAREHEEIDGDESEERVEAVGLSNGDHAGDSDQEMVPVDDMVAAMADAGDQAIEDERDEDDDEDMEDDEDGHFEDSDESDESEDDDEAEEHDNEAGQSFLFQSAFNRSVERSRVHMSTPCVASTKRYEGAANVRTVKDVNFYGPNDEYVVSGSDSGHFFIWDRQTTQLLNILEGDGEVVNVVQGHPHEPMLAVSGIDHTIKVFSADAKARRAARRGEGVNKSDSSGFSSILGRRGPRIGMPRRRAPPQDPATPEALSETPPPAAREDSSSTPNEGGTSEPAVPSSSNDNTTANDDAYDSDFDSDKERAAPNGLESRRRIHLEYQIKAQNDNEREERSQDAYITREMMARLLTGLRLRRAAARRRNGQGGGGDGDGEDGEGDGDEDDEDDDLGLPIDMENGRVVMGEDCVIM